jgi:hypothetical protein
MYPSSVLCDEGLATLGGVCLASIWGTSVEWGLGRGRVWGVGM